MHQPGRIRGILFSLLSIPLLLSAQSLKIITNHVGYEDNGAKRAIIMGELVATDEPVVAIDAFQLVNAGDQAVVYSGKPVLTGPVAKWRNWVFWTIDFSDFKTDGRYQLQISYGGKTVSSYPFEIGKNVLAQSTISDVIYYFKGQRSSGLLDKADHHLAKAGSTIDTIDAHGGWYDATGDYGKHLSQLSFTSYFNTQQIPLTVWGLLRSYQWLKGRKGTDYRQYCRRLLDEAMYGADYLTRIQPGEGSFYISVSAPGPAKRAKDRLIETEMKGYQLRKSKDQGIVEDVRGNNWRDYEASYRSGGGVAIAALALASTFETSGDFSNTQYLQAAERAFAFLEKDNLKMVNDGKENMVDDYCALLAATELYKATKKRVYSVAADKRAARLAGRLQSWKGYRDYWRVDENDQPFFSASDAGLPLVSLLNYYPVADEAMQGRLKSVIRRSLEFELAITREVNNPFGYSRQLVQDTAGKRYSSFFFPHGTATSPWWQGENARLGSMATAARMAANLFSGETAFHDSLENFGLDQLNWILGLNPFDACMMQGKGHNNPQYGFFGTFEYTNAPGGIVNGITSGMKDEEGIDFNLRWAQTGKDDDWRWAEQWLPHDTWFLLAVSVGE